MICEKWNRFSDQIMPPDKRPQAGYIVSTS
jgi:hypothetical protein